MKKITLLIVLLTLGSLALFAQPPGVMDGQQFRRGMRNFQQGQPMYGQRGMGNDWDNEHFQGMFEELELTDTQHVQISELRDTHRKWSIQHNADVKTLQIDKDAALRDNDFTKAKKITKQIFEKKSTAAIKRLELRESIWNILTKEQQEKCNTMKHQRPQHKMRHQLKTPARHGA